MSATGSCRDTGLYVAISEFPADLALEKLLPLVTYPECGATVTFQGIVRETENGERIAGLHYEYHPELALQELQNVVRDALRLFKIRTAACVHLVGFVPIEAPSVAIAVGADHRAPAFQACEFIIDELKRRVPIWKSVVTS